MTEKQIGPKFILIKTLDENRKPVIARVLYKPGETAGEVIDTALVTPSKPLKSRGGQSESPQS